MTGLEGRQGLGASSAGWGWGEGGGIQLVTPSLVCDQGRHTGTCLHTLGVSLEFLVNSSLGLGFVRESERTAAPVGVEWGALEPWHLRAPISSPSLLPASQPPAPCPGVRGRPGASPVPTPRSQSCSGQGVGSMLHVHVCAGHRGCPWRQGSPALPLVRFTVYRRASKQILTDTCTEGTAGVLDEE